MKNLLETVKKSVQLANIEADEYLQKQLKKTKPIEPLEAGEPQARVSRSETKKLDLIGPYTII